MSSYDLDRSGVIEKREMIAAITDYFNGEITKSDVIAVITFYFSGERVETTSTAGPAQVSDMIARVRPAIVKVVNASGGQGSGVIFKTDAQYAYVVTNQHVVRRAPTVIVTVEDITEYTGTVLGVDVNRDLAVVQIACPDCSFIEFGDSDTLNPGDVVVVAVGYPWLRGPAGRGTRHEGFGGQAITVEMSL